MGKRQGSRKVAHGYDGKRQGHEYRPDGARAIAGKAARPQAKSIPGQFMRTSPWRPIPLGGLPVTAALAISQNWTTLLSFTSQ